MKSVVIFICVIALAWTFPKSEDRQDELQYKRLYIDPVISDSEAINGRITNGQEAAPHSLPYMVYMIVTGPAGRWLCGGSLISRRHVLTAAHCIVDATSAILYLGAHNVRLNEETQLRVTATRFIPHEDYVGTYNDIGVIRLNRRVTLNQYIGTVRLPAHDQTCSYEGESGKVSGWGLTDGSVLTSTSPVLQEVNGTIMNNDVCNSYYLIVEDNQICTSGLGGVGSCNGDSGGPLVVGNTQIGVVSYGARGCPNGLPSVYARVTSFRRWLIRKTGIIF